MKRGVLLTGFGGPDCLDAVEPFMCSLMSREPAPELVESAKRRYLAIGGGSPLPMIAERIAAQLERELSGMPRAEMGEEDGTDGVGDYVAGRQPGLRAPEAGISIPVAVGMCHAEPSVERGVAELIGAGVREIVMVSMSPYDSVHTTGTYRRVVEEAVAAHEGVTLVEAAHYHMAAPFIDVWTTDLVEQLHDIDILQNKTLVVFSAHSLPVADVEADPAYVQQLRETARAVAESSGLGEPGAFDALGGIEAYGGPGVTAPWLLAFQSKGRTPGEWLGPDLDETIDAAAAEGFRAVIVCPIGFITDHLETLYDIDIMAADRVLLADMEWARVRTPNDDQRMIEALASAVRAVI
ncbi:MAG: ferrochelatase [Coriobacteriia bacterium]|nr:ferrochelatase [Coriobacteriia bacterium]